MKSSKRFLFVDIETTGLEAEYQHMLEFGAILTDAHLKTISTFREVVWDNPTERRVTQLKAGAAQGIADAEFIVNMHTVNELFDEAELEGLHPEEVEQRFLHWMHEHDLGISDPVCGSSVHFDRTFMNRFMHEANVKLSYRNIDTSTLKELYVRWGCDDGTAAEKPASRKLHRVIPDIEDSIEELKWYQREFLATRDLDIL